jgi:ferric-dicitrate binding protein FerR (iron transport regulator)
MRRLAVAAAVLILFAGGAWWMLSRTGRKPELSATHKPGPVMAQDIAPGGNRATLILSDSTTIDLDAANAGLLGQQGNVQIIKRKDGQLAYQPADHHPLNGAQRYNLLTTPRGGQYQLVLPDGSKVWLNAASSLRYPAEFTGKERVVELKGEAYFEIAKNAAMPFRVSIADDKGGKPVQVNVLGTHFNVNAYPDEPTVNTTLLEGLVKVQKGAASVTVKPGESANCQGEGGIELAAADMEEAVAWKNGLFKFSEASLEEVMRQLARWYDVEVVYVNGPTKDLFRGEIYRNVSVSKVLKVLEASGVRFTVEGKKILVQS